MIGFLALLVAAIFLALLSGAAQFWRAERRAQRMRTDETDEAGA